MPALSLRTDTADAQGAGFLCNLLVVGSWGRINRREKDKVDYGQGKGDSDIY